MTSLKIKQEFVDLIKLGEKTIEIRGKCSLKDIISFSIDSKLEFSIAVRHFKTDKLLGILEFSGFSEISFIHLNHFYNSTIKFSDINCECYICQKLTFQLDIKNNKDWIKRHWVWIENFAKKEKLFFVYSIKNIKLIKTYI